MSTDRNVIVVGGGVAGLNAAVALAGDGVAVTVLERRGYVGGRAYSYLHPALHEVVDSQHVLVGCCTNLIDFCDRAGLADRIRWYDRQTFLEPGGRQSIIQASGLPAPLHFAASFLGASTLTLADKAAIARGLSGLLRGYLHPGVDLESAAAWYRRSGQTAGAIRHFWEPVLLATLNDNAANCSMKYAGKVFHELFLKSSTGGRLGIPTVPLSDFYAAGADRVRALGGAVELRAGVEALEQLGDGRWAVRTEGGVSVADDVILALQFEQTRRLIDGMTLSDPAGETVRANLTAQMDRFLHAPFLSILLWFDRQICDLDHAWLLDTTIQWFFHKSRIRGYPSEQGSYVELVIAGSRRELPMSRAELLGPALDELARFFPDTRKATLLKSGILKEARATFSVLPGLDGSRPSQSTGIPGLYLAGDWTRTGWPSTMEGAARSGRLAAGALRGSHSRFLVPELPPSGLMRLLAATDSQDGTTG